MSSFTKTQGFTLIEILIVVAISGMLMVSLSNIVGGALSANYLSNDRNDLNREASYAMNRIVEVVSHAPSVSIATVSGDFYITALLDPARDTNLDGIADADNDGDGMIDEDTDAILGDDDSDGQIDEDWEDKVIISSDLASQLLTEEDPFPMDVNSPASVDTLDKRTYTRASKVTLFQGFITSHPDHRYDVLKVKLELTSDTGEVITRETAIRIGSVL